MKIVKKVLFIILILLIIALIAVAAIYIYKIIGMHRALGYRYV